MFRCPIAEMTGYEMKSTYWDDFCIAERFGLKEVEGLANRAFKMYKDDIEFGTELTMVLNWKIHQWYGVNDELAKLYNSLWEKFDGYIMENWKGEELSYFLRTTD